MADQAVLKYLSIDTGTTFDPCYLSLDSTLKQVKQKKHFKSDMFLNATQIVVQIKK